MKLLNITTRYFKDVYRTVFNAKRHFGFKETARCGRLCSSQQLPIILCRFMHVSTNIGHFVLQLYIVKTSCLNYLFLNKFTELPL